MRFVRGGPGQFESRLRRAEALDTPAPLHPLAFARAALGHQVVLAADAQVRAAAGFLLPPTGDGAVTAPMLDLARAVEPLDRVIEPTVEALAPSDAVPDPLAEAGRELSAASPSERRPLIAAWLEEASLVDPRTGVWLRVAAGPTLELAAAQIDTSNALQRRGDACPACGDVPQCGAIVEESGGMLQGSPRYLICGRCATWWSWPRAVCPWCGEDDSEKLGPYVAEGQDLIRLDACDSCGGYIKTFELRKPEASEIVPLVDDVASLALDLWAQEKGLRRVGANLAGV